MEKIDTFLFIFTEWSKRYQMGSSG